MSSDNKNRFRGTKDGNATKAGKRKGGKSPKGDWGSDPRLWMDVRTIDVPWVWTTSIWFPPHWRAWKSEFIGSGGKTIKEREAWLGVSIRIGDGVVSVFPGKSAVTHNIMHSIYLDALHCMTRARHLDGFAPRATGPFHTAPHVLHAIELGMSSLAL